MSHESCHFLFLPVNLVEKEPIQSRRVSKHHQAPCFFCLGKNAAFEAEKLDGTYSESEQMKWWFFFGGGWRVVCIFCCASLVSGNRNKSKGGGGHYCTPSWMDAVFNMLIHGDLVKWWQILNIRSVYFWRVLLFLSSSLLSHEFSVSLFCLFAFEAIQEISKAKCYVFQPFCGSFNDGNLHCLWMLLLLWRVTIVLE